MKHADDQKFAKLFGEFIRDSRGLKKVSQQELALAHDLCFTAVILKLSSDKMLVLKC